jgi:type IV pilus assembly protein PilO
MDMDFRDSKNQKIIVAVLAFLVVIYFWYSRLYSAYDAQIESRTQEFETVTTHLRSVEMKAKSLSGLKEEYTQLVNQYRDIESLLPEVKMIPSLLVQLHTASSLTGTRITKVQPMPLNQEDFYNVAPFEIEMTGTYHDFGKFVSYVANFPFIANISNMNIKAQKVAVSKNEVESAAKEVGKKKETITATFTLSSYFVREDERLKELTL